MTRKDDYKKNGIGKNSAFTVTLIECYEGKKQGIEQQAAIVDLNAPISNIFPFREIVASLIVTSNQLSCTISYHFFLVLSLFIFTSFLHRTQWNNVIRRQTTEHTMPPTM